jgi:hypothetical protein
LQCCLCPDALQAVGYKKFFTEAIEDLKRLPKIFWIRSKHIPLVKKLIQPHPFVFGILKNVTNTTGIYVTEANVQAAEAPERHSLGCPLFPNVFRRTVHGGR